MTDPRITIGVITTHDSHHLIQSIESILFQSLTPLEIIILDTGENPNINKAIRSFLNQSTIIISHLTFPWKSKAEAKNNILLHCSTSHIMFIDNHHSLHPHALESIVDTLNSRADADVIFGKAILCDKSLEPQQYSPLIHLEGSDRLHAVFNENPLPVAGVLYNSETIKHAGGFNNDFLYEEDYALLAKLISAHSVLIHTNSEVSFIRQLPSLNNEATQQKYNELLSVKQYLLANNTIESIFPHYAWNTHPERALYQTAIELVSHFVRLGGFAMATDVLFECTVPKFIAEINFFKLVIANARELGLNGLYDLRSNPIFASKENRLIVRALVDYLCPEEQRVTVMANLFSEGHSETLLIQKIKDSKRASNRSIQGTSQVHNEYLQEDIPHVCQVSVPLFEEAAELLREPHSAAQLHRDTHGVRPHKIILKSETSKSPISISIIIPTCNRPKLLPETVKSVCLQQTGSYEIIIVNDGGSPIPESSLQSFKESPIPITVIEHDHNCGLGATRNTGAYHAQGEWLMVLDDDDLLVPGALFLLEEASKSQEVDFIYGDHIRQYFEDGERTHQEYRRISQNCGATLLLENPILCGSFIIRRSLFRLLGGYREDFKVHEDYNLHLRVAAHGKMHHVPTAIMIYNIRNNLGRMNDSLRPYWFATAAINHELASRIFLTQRELKQDQRVNRYKHLVRAFNEGVTQEVILQLIHQWWKILEEQGLQQEVEIEQRIVESLLPELGQISIPLHMKTPQRSAYDTRQLVS